MGMDAGQHERVVVGGWCRALGKSRVGVAGLVVVVVMGAVCVGSLPWTLGAGVEGTARYNAGRIEAARLPPTWWGASAEQAVRLNRLVEAGVVAEIAARHGVSVEEAVERTEGAVGEALRGAWPRSVLGTDVLGRSLMVRLLAGGGISLGIGLAAALISVGIGTLYGMVAGYVGGRVDGVMMRVVDVLYGLPYVLLVVLLAVAGDALVDQVQRGRIAEATRERGVFVEEAVARGVEAEAARREAVVQIGTGEIGRTSRMAIDVMTLLAAIGGVSWLTLARVIRGQVLSLKEQTFVEAARAVGASPWRIMRRHLLPNLVGPVVVYSTLTVPQAILQESFLSFLGIGVKPPLPSWGTLAAEGLGELNPYASNWWLLVFPCVALGVTLVSLNFVGEGLREALDPRRSRA